MDNKSQATIGIKVFMATILLLAVLIAVAGGASYVIPAGSFSEQIVNGEAVQVYQQIDQTPLPVWKIALSPIMCLTGETKGQIIFIIAFIFFIGGSFAIMNHSGILSQLLSDLVERFSHHKTLFLVVNICLFSVMGSCLGILEELVPMVLIFVPLAYRMGWDSITGLAIPFLSAGFGFAAATFNPFTVGTAQRLAEVQIFSGLALRAPFFVISTLCVIGYLLWYTKRIETDPSKSATYAMDQKVRHLLELDDFKGFDGNHRAAYLWMGFCFLLIVAVVMLGPFISVLQQLAFPLIALIFVIMGFGVGFCSGNSAKRVFKFFLSGLADFSPAIILILMASAVGYLINEGNIMDTILNHIASRAQYMGSEAAVLSIFGVQMAINFFIPSGSGQAFLTIPILAPLGDLIGITRQTVVLAYQFGDGFSNLFWPTNPTLLISLGLAGVSYKDWFKWVLPIQLVLLLICIAFLMLAVNIGF